MKKKILIIGFGNIGFRHFQALYKKNNFSKFYIYDKSKKNIYSKINSNKNIIILNRFLEKKINNIFFDLIIIATPSIKRFEIFKKIVKKIKFRHMLIEKFLFNEKKNYDDCLELIKNVNSKIFVHCPRTEWKYFKDLKKFIKGKIKIEYTGYNWRIASNSIHFLDLFSFLINSEEIRLKKIKVDDKIQSKRNNYMEFYGKLNFVSNNNSSLMIDDNKKYKSSYMKIKFANFIDEIKINMGQMNLIRYKDKRKILEKNYKIPLTSKLTGKIIKNIFENKKVNLTELRKSIKLHMILFPVLLEVFYSKKSRRKFLPVT